MRPSGKSPSGDFWNAHPRGVMTFYACLQGYMHGRIGAAPGVYLCTSSTHRSSRVQQVRTTCVVLNGDLCFAAGAALLQSKPSTTCRRCADPEFAKRQHSAINGFSREGHWMCAPALAAKR